MKGLVVVLLLAVVGATGGACGGTLLDECAPLGAGACTHEARCLLDHSAPNGQLRCVVACNAGGTCEDGLVRTIIPVVKKNQGNVETHDIPTACACLAAER